MANGDNEMKTIMKACLGECDQEAIKGVFDCKDCVSWFASIGPFVKQRPVSCLISVV